MTEKKYKLKDLRQQSQQELKDLLQKAQSETISERGAAASGTKTAGKIRQMKKLIARILTILKEKESQPKTEDKKPKEVQKK